MDATSWADHTILYRYGLCQKGGRGCPSAWMQPQPDGFHSTYQLPQFIKAILNAADGSLRGPSSAQWPLELRPELGRALLTGRESCVLSWAELCSVAVRVES